MKQNANIPHISVQTWFQNRRAKCKRKIDPVDLMDKNSNSQPALQNQEQNSMQSADLETSEVWGGLSLSKLQRIAASVKASRKTTDPASFKNLRETSCQNKRAYSDPWDSRQDYRACILWILKRNFFQNWRAPKLWNLKRICSIFSAKLLSLWPLALRCE